MSLDRWLTLRAGDIIRAERSGIDRVVLAASPGGGIRLKKLHGSWTDPCPHTTYCRNDRRNFRYTGRRVSRVPAVVCPLPHHTRCTDGR